jgi:hypothetical protein
MLSVTPDQTAIPLQMKGQRGACDLVRLCFVCDRGHSFFLLTRFILSC